MSLLAQLALKEARATYQVYVAGQPVTPLSIQIDLGYDVASSSASVILPTVPDVLQLRQELEIWLGWNGYTIPRFKGYIDDDGRGWFPFGHNVRASGYSKLMQMKYPEAVTYSSETDTEIADDLASRAGVVNRVIEGAGTTLGTIQPVVLSNGTPPFSLMNLLDQTFGYKTFDISDGVVVRLPISGRPAATAAYAFAEGVNIKRIDRKQGNVDEIKNKVNIFGLPQETYSQPMSEWESPNPLVPNPPRFNPHDLHSDLIESLAVATAVGGRVSGEVNGLPDTVIIDTWWHPVNPGQTISVLSPKIGLTSATNYLVKHVTDRVDVQGENIRITAERRIGDLGTELGKRPIAAFTYRITSETFVSGKLYTVTTDAAGSFDPDSPFSDLTFAWSNNKNADTGSGTVYTTHFTEAQMQDSTPPTITLVVNDADASSGSGTIVKTINPLTDPINARALYVAASSRAEATPDGGETWRTWTPGAGTVISTPPISAVGLGLFGLSNGKLMATLDYLVAAPTETHDFGSAVNFIWVNESDGNRVAVLLANGEIWLTNNMGDLASSTWAMLTDLPAQGNAIEESAANPGQFRLATSNQLIISFDSFGASGEATNLGGGATAKRIVTSPFSNYVSGDGGDKVKREDGVAITGITDTNVRGLASHIRANKLFAGSEAGHTWQKAEGATVFTAKVTLPTSPGQINYMINDGDNQRIFYAAAEGGLYKSDDEWTSANMMRDYSGAGLDGLMVGRESLTLTNPALDGRRMIVFFLHTDGTPRIGHSENVFGASTIWVNDSTTGLPSSGWTDGYFQLDPFNTSIAYITRFETGVGWTLYRNNAWKTPGSTWSVIFDVADYNALTGRSEASISFSNTHGKVNLSIVSEGYVGIFMTGVADTDGSYRYFHSHDRGDNWTVSAGLTNMAGGGVGRISVVSPKNAALVWIYGHSGGGSPHGPRKSIDHGHTFPSTGDVGVVTYGPNEWEIPTENNPDSLVQYTYADGFFGEDPHMSRSLDGGVMFAAIGNTHWASAGAGEVDIASDDRNKIYQITNVSGNTYLRRSVNAGATSTVEILGSIYYARFAVLRSNRIYYLAESSPYVATSEDHITLTPRTGNLTTAVGTPSANRCLTVTVDFTT